jgi:hypothetical protein
MRQAVFELFHASYRNANDSYLERSLHALGAIAIAQTPDGELVGFALGESRTLDVPRLGNRLVSLAGIACVDPRWRRRGLFSALAGPLLDGSPDTGGERLAAGRVAHPASYRSFALPSAVPRPGLSLTSWHKEVGAVVAAAYGAHDFDAEHFVCIGEGAGPGEPIVDIEGVTDEERGLFEYVDRRRGDGLLVIGWFPSAPDGWLDPR